MKVQSSPARRGKHTLGEAQLQAVADLFAVLSEPNRLRILQVLQDGPATVTDVMARLGMKQGNASKQLGILFQAGVLGRRKEGLSVRYWIRMPLVFDLCSLVCGHLRDDAVARAEALS